MAFRSLPNHPRLSVRSDDQKDDNNSVSISLTEDEFRDLENFFFSLSALEGLLENNNQRQAQELHHLLGVLGGGLDGVITKLGFRFDAQKGEVSDGQ